MFWETQLAKYSIWIPLLEYVVIFYGYSNYVWYYYDRHQQAKGGINEIKELVVTNPCI